MRLYANAVFFYLVNVRGCLPSTLLSRWTRKGVPATTILPKDCVSEGPAVSGTTLDETSMFFGTALATRLSLHVGIARGTMELLRAVPSPKGEPKSRPSMRDISLRPYRDGGLKKRAELPREGAGREVSNVGPPLESPRPQPCVLGTSLTAGRLAPAASGCWCDSRAKKSSTCMDGGRLVLGGRERNGSLARDWWPMLARDSPRPRIGAMNGFLVLGSVPSGPISI